MAGNRNSGRTKGTPNKFTASIKEAFRQAFDDLGGVSSLVKWGRANPDDFYKLVSKLIPQEITGADGGPIAIIAHVRELVLADGAGVRAIIDADAGRNGSVAHQGTIAAPATPASSRKNAS